jgi:hypothetical protein
VTGGSAFVDRFPPPEQPWTHEYVDVHRRLVGEVLDDPELVRPFKEGGRLPPGYGVGLDERVVELPWIFGQGFTGRVLDAGSALNHQHILDRALPLAAELHVVTLEPEELAFTQRRVSYVYADVRDLPYKDGYFDTVVSLSTLEHVGMENARYGVTEPRADDPALEMARAIVELTRVSVGPMLLSVPYGRQEDHGWFRQFDRADVETLLEAAGGRASVTVYRYSADGWQVGDLESAAGVSYRDFTADPTPVEDLAAAARAVACVAVQPER